MQSSEKMIDNDSINKIEKRNLIDDVFTELKKETKGLADENDKLEVLIGKIETIIENRINSEMKNEKNDSADVKLERKIYSYKITPKEKEIILLLMEGFTSREIARVNNISVSTVNNHIQNIYKKLGVNNRLMLINVLMNREIKCKFE